MSQLSSFLEMNKESLCSRTRHRDAFYVQNPVCRLPLRHPSCGCSCVQCIRLGPGLTKLTCTVNRPNSSGSKATTTYIAHNSMGGTEFNRASPRLQAIVHWLAEGGPSGLDQTHSRGLAGSQESVQQWARPLEA